LINEILLNKKIERIDLRCKPNFKKKSKDNQITYKGLKYLKESFTKNKDLLEISFYCNKISNYGCIVLNQIIKNSKIQIIDLGGEFFI
jgi:hypothetical protein